MQYLKVRWIHQCADDPVTLLSEIDRDGWEIRKIEVFCNGSTGFADDNEEQGGTSLGEVSVPPIEEINKDAQFCAEWISKEEFETAWQNRMVNIHADE